MHFQNRQCYENTSYRLIVSVRSPSPGRWEGDGRGARGEVSGRSGWRQQVPAWHHRPKLTLLFPPALGYHDRASMRGTTLFRALALAAALLAVGCRQAPERAAGPETAAGKPRRGCTGGPGG